MMRPVLVISALVLGVAFAQEAPIVSTRSGMVQGVHSVSYKGLPYMDFSGIPYAEPPLGELRFEDPVPAKPWQGTLMANTSTSCLQVAHSVDPAGGTEAGSEDCLHLNIFVPGTKIDPDAALDVLVHFHGGAFVMAHKDDYQGPKFLMDKRSVILVSPNYRLGIHGFLSTGDKYLPGNLGMKDQVMVLRWIQENVHFFGGDPKSVTITGFSAGGASVHYHMMSPMSRGLFARAISASGVAMNCWALQEKPLEKALVVGRAVGCRQTSTRSLARCLKAADPGRLRSAIRKLRSWLYNPFSPVAPIVDPWSDTPFLPRHPYELLKLGLVADVPWLATFVTSEGLYPAAEFILSPSYLEDLDRKWDDLAPEVLHYRDTIADGEMAEVSRAIRKEYLGNLRIDNSTYNTLVKIVTDRLYLYDIGTATRLQANATKSPVWVYHFDYELEQRETFSHRFIHKDDKLGVCHGDDQVMIYSDPRLEAEEQMVPNDERIKDFLVDIYASFAKTGSPGIPEWSTVAKDVAAPLRYLHIGRDGEHSMQSAEDVGNGRFWRGLPFEENEHLFTDSMK